MVLTVKKLKEILSDLDDDVILADLGMGNNNFNPFNYEKRLLLLKSNFEWGNKTYLTINGMGSHFTGEGQQKGLEYTGICFND